MGKTASITLLAGTLLMAGCAVTAHPAYVGHSARGSQAHPAHPRTHVPGHWEQRGRHPGFDARRDRDRDGVPNRVDRDRDGDGVPNRFDRAPDHRRWR